MDCVCGSRSKVVSTVKKGVLVFRERKCDECYRRWYTEERENNSVRVAAALSNRKKWKDDGWDSETVD